MKLKLYSGAFLATAILTAGALSAQSIHTGGKGGAYFGQFCPAVESILSKSQFRYICVESQGSQDNVDRIRRTPSDIGFGQLDVFALENKQSFGDSKLQMIRSDVARECLFMVTRDRDLDTFGEISARASQLRFVLPPTGSGSTATFKLLQEIDPDGLGRAYDITYADSTDDAIRRALSSDNTVTMFVQFADPKNARFQRIVKGDGQFIPVLSREILRQEVDGEKIYYADETQVSNATWAKTGKTVITSCTPMVIFTGSSEDVQGQSAQSDHRDMIKTLKAVKKEDLAPKRGLFARIWDRTKALSAVAVEKSLKASEEAREAAGPMMEKARERMQELGEQAKDLGQRAKELGQDAYDRSKDAVENYRNKQAN